MAHPIDDILNRIEKKKAIKCDCKCKYWTFPHLRNACVLSEVFSVNKNEYCFNYKIKTKKELKDE